MQRLSVGQPWRVPLPTRRRLQVIDDELARLLFHRALPPVLDGTGRPGTRPPAGLITGVPVPTPGANLGPGCERGNRWGVETWIRESRKSGLSPTVWEAGGGPR